MNVVIIGSGNGLAPVQCQANTWTNGDYSPLQLDSWAQILMKFISKHNIFHDENVFEIFFAEGCPFC